MDDQHEVSDTQIVFYGDEFVEDYGAGNRSGESTARGHIIAPGGDDDLLAWAHYTASGLIDTRPVSLLIDVASIMAPGGDDDLPMSYWVGVSNYTQDAWQWFGPFTDDATLELNSTTARDRFVSADYNMNFIILTECPATIDSPQNPDNLPAVEICSSTVITEFAKDSSYYLTNPIFTSINSLSVDKQAVTMTWEHVVDEGNPKLEAKKYTVYRKRVGDDKMKQLVKLDAPAESYVDAADADEGKDPPVPGEAYYYYVQASNDKDDTPPDMAGPITIPLDSEE